jgi:hypothetical protein
LTIWRTTHPLFASTSHGPALADVLIGLGHDCPMGCSRAAAELGAPVWLTRRGLPMPTSSRPALVVVDSAASGAPLGRSHQLVRYLDHCARADNIRVRDRRASDVARSDTTTIVLDAAHAGPPWAI